MVPSLTLRCRCECSPKNVFGIQIRSSELSEIKELLSQLIVVSRGILTRINESNNSLQHQTGHQILIGHGDGTLVFKNTFDPHTQMQCVFTITALAPRPTDATCRAISTSNREI